MHFQDAIHRQKHLGPIVGATFVLLLLLCLSLPASSLAAKRSDHPVTVILGHPARVSHSSQATFVFYSNYWDVDSYLCSLDGHAYKPCVPLKTYYGLKKGKHRFAVKAVTDGMAGSAVRFAWVIQIKKKVAPIAVVITSHPSLTTVSTNATFAFYSNKRNATFVCVIDKQASTNDGGYTPCMSPTTYTDLAPGNHVFTVVAMANHLSSSPKAFVWTVSPVAPHNTALPTITGGIRAGQTLTASNGTWTGSLPVSHTYQWQLCSGGSLVLAGLSTAPTTGPVFCGDIVGATNSSYTIEDAGLLGAVGFLGFRSRLLRCAVPLSESLWCPVAFWPGCWELPNRPGAASDARSVS